jgi:hypothetical protein
VIRLALTPLAEEQLLAAIAAQPERAKLSIPRLRDALVSQADVLDLMQCLVAAGKLDRATLRPVSRGARAPLGDRRFRENRPSVTKLPPAREFRPTGAELFKRIIAEVERRAITRRQASVEIFGHASQLSTMQDNRSRAAAGKTLEKVEAWLASSSAEAPQVAEEPAVSLLPPPAPEPQPTGAELAAELDALIAEHGLSKTKVSVHLFKAKGGIEVIRRRRTVKPVTIDRVRSLLADPPLGALRRERKARGVLPPPALTKAEHQQYHRRPRQNGSKFERTAATARKGATSEAKALLERDPDATHGRNGVVTGALNALKAQQAAEERQADPLEQAKLALQRKGRTVYASSVVGGPNNRFVVSGLGTEVTPAALIAEAERVTGLSFRRTA